MVSVLQLITKYRVIQTVTFKPSPPQFFFQDLFLASSFNRSFSFSFVTCYFWSSGYNFCWYVFVWFNKYYMHSCLTGTQHLPLVTVGDTTRANRSSNLFFPNDVCKEVEFCCFLLQLEACPICVCFILFPPQGYGNIPK